MQFLSKIEQIETIQVWDGAQLENYSRFCIDAEELQRTLLAINLASAPEPPRLTLYRLSKIYITLPPEVFQRKQTA
jgi:hypothetical protein